MLLKHIEFPLILAKTKSKCMRGIKLYEMSARRNGNLYWTRYIVEISNHLFPICDGQCTVHAST